MSSAARRTIAHPAEVAGVGLHTGTPSTLRFRPAPSGEGIAFRRTDLAGAPRIPALADRAQLTQRRTVLGEGEATVSTVEHVLAAVAAHGLDDLLIDLDGPEPPGGDGSAAPFFEALRKARPVEQGGTPTEFRLPAPITVREGDARYVVAPADGLRLTVTIEWPHPLIGRQSGCYDITPESFAAHLAQARTFGFTSEAAALAEQGLARGANPTSAIVLSETALAAGSLRWPDEFVRHKAADLLGDLALLGGRLQAEVVAFRPSHRGNLALVRTLRRVTSPTAPAVMGVREILGLLPHRYPMLLVDRIVEVEGRERIVGIKNVTINEAFFQGHFPDYPIMPGVLIIEAMAQVGGLLLLGAVERPETKLVLFMALDNVKFRRPVVPGDQIRFEVRMLRLRGQTCQMRGEGYVDGQLVAEAEMMARITDK